MSTTYNMQVKGAAETAMKIKHVQEAVQELKLALDNLNESKIIINIEIKQTAAKKHWWSK